MSITRVRQSINNASETEDSSQKIAIVLAEPHHCWSRLRFGAGVGFFQPIRCRLFSGVGFFAGVGFFQPVDRGGVHVQQHTLRFFLTAPLKSDNPPHKKTSTIPCRVVDVDDPHACVHSSGLSYEKGLALDAFLVVRHGGPRQ